MDQYVPIEKRSKKAKRELAKARRGTWGALNPVTRKPANPKAYNRKKARHEGEFFDGGFCFPHRYPHPGKTGITNAMLRGQQRAVAA